jgi:hypothetical protein
MIAGTDGCSLFGKLQVGVLRRQGLRLVGRQVFAEVDVDGMIQIERLTARQRSPRNQRFHVVRER